MELLCGIPHIHIFMLLFKTSEVYFVCFSLSLRSDPILSITIREHHICKFAETLSLVLDFIFSCKQTGI